MKTVNERLKGIRESSKPTKDTLNEGLGGSYVYADDVYVDIVGKVPPSVIEKGIKRVATAVKKGKLTTRGKVQLLVGFAGSYPVLRINQKVKESMTSPEEAKARGLLFGKSFQQRL